MRSGMTPFTFKAQSHMKLSGYFCWENVLILGISACKLYTVVNVVRKSGKLGTLTACWRNQKENLTGPKNPSGWRVIEIRKTHCMSCVYADSARL
jgi:hypothetical protein